MPDNRSNRIVRVLIYTFPALFDMIVAQFLFVNTLRLAKMSEAPLVAATIVPFWSLVYMVACPLVGRCVTVANAARFILASCALVIGLAGLFVVLPGIPAMYALSGLMGIATALFFPPFQVFMKAVDTAQQKPITYSTGLYTFAWSAGYATGPFISGLLMETGSAAGAGQETSGWKLTYAVSALAAAAVGAGILRLRHLIHPDDPAAPPAGAAPAGLPDFSRQPDLAWLGWAGAGIGVVLVSVIRAVFPSHAVNTLHLADSTQGLLSFILSMAQAFTGLALCRSRRWMYRPLPVAAIGLAGILAIGAFGVFRSPVTLALAAVLFGVYAGCFFFYLVFHALAHPIRSSFYVAINESVVGVGGIIGPLAAGWLASRFTFAWACGAGAAVLLAATAFQSCVHRRRPAIDDA